MLFFFEVFQEEKEAILRFLPKNIYALFYENTIQEEKCDIPNQSIISTRTQSVIPLCWESKISAILTRSTGHDHMHSYRNNMFGFPTETLEEMQQSLEFIMMLNRKYGTDVRFANQFNLEEDTPLFKNPEAFGVTKITNATRGSQGHGYHYEVANGATPSEVAAFCKTAQVFLKHPSLYIFRRFFFGFTT
jgi:hypothetical protein